MVAAEPGGAERNAIRASVDAAAMACGVVKVVLEPTRSVTSAEIVARPRSIISGDIAEIRPICASI